MPGTVPALHAPAHSWQAVSIGRTSVAHKAMLFAGKSLALCGARLMADPELLASAKREFDSRIAVTPYICPIPEGVQPKY